MKMDIGGKCNWKGQPDRLVYMGKVGVWHQFALVDNPDKVWCEVLEEDLHMLEKTSTDKPKNKTGCWTPEVKNCDCPACGGFND